MTTGYMLVINGVGKFRKLACEGSSGLDRQSKTHGLHAIGEQLSLGCHLSITLHSMLRHLAYLCDIEIDIFKLE